MVSGKKGCSVEVVDGKKGCSVEVVDGKMVGVLRWWMGGWLEC